MDQEILTSAPEETWVATLDYFGKSSRIEET